MQAIFTAIGDVIIIELFQSSVGIFPKIWKKGSIVCIPKKDGALRPITMLPALGKVLDRVINKTMRICRDVVLQTSSVTPYCNGGSGSVECL